jgi:hypothetical protein
MDMIATASAQKSGVLTNKKNKKTSDGVAPAAAATPAVVVTKTKKK